MKYIISLYFVFLSFLSIGQSKKTIDLSCGIAYTDILITGEDKFANALNDGINSDYGYSVGIGINRKLSDYVYLKSGLKLTTIGTKSDLNTDIKFPHNNDTLPVNEPNRVQLFFQNYYLEIPIILRYEFKNKYLPYVEFGLSPHIYVKQRIKQVTDLDTKIRYDSNYNGKIYNRIVFISSLSLGYNFTYSDKYILFSQFTYKIGVINLKEKHIKSITYRPISIGFDIGGRYVFK